MSTALFSKTLDHSSLCSLWAIASKHSWACWTSEVFYTLIALDTYHFLATFLYCVLIELENTIRTRHKRLFSIFTTLYDNRILQYDTTNEMGGPQGCLQYFSYNGNGPYGSSLLNKAIVNSVWLLRNVVKPVMMYFQIV